MRLTVANQAAPTCDYFDDHDETGPCGNRCGRPATRAIRWRDGRISLGCREHATEVKRTCPTLIRKVFRITPVSEGGDR